MNPCEIRDKHHKVIRIGDYIVAEKFGPERVKVLAIGIDGHAYIRDEYTGAIVDFVFPRAPGEPYFKADAVEIWQPKEPSAFDAWCKAFEGRG